MVPVDAVTDDEVARLRRELERLRAENLRLSRLLELRGQDIAPAPEQLAAMATPGPVTMASPVREKLAFYVNMFRGRRDAYAKRWENDRLSPGDAEKVARRAKQAAVGTGVMKISRSDATKVHPPLPMTVQAELAAGLSIDTSQLPAAVPTSRTSPEGTGT